MKRSEAHAAYTGTRKVTEDLCAPLKTEDYVIQSIPDVSPPKWHLGHTSWFFERVILHKYTEGYQPVDERYYFVFNSYYQSFGDRVARDIRGTLSRPTVEEVYAYRKVIDERIGRLLDSLKDDIWPEVASLLELGLHHEQQHQELLVTDVKYNLAMNPLRPSYREAAGTGNEPGRTIAASAYLPVEGGIIAVGAGAEGFAWDNERPRHQLLISDFGIMNRVVTCGEYLEFIQDGGYENPLLWLSDGWDTATQESWKAPLY
ncbi:MAG: DinB family protein, partial [Bacteroidetes bacterium]|nr:DinB family protein [Bacteroidota bacterium]